MKDSRLIHFLSSYAQPYALAIILGFVVLALAACGGNDPESDHSFVTDQPCAPPCWYGLEVEKSSRAQVYDTFKQLPFVDQTHIVEAAGYWLNNNTASRYITWGCVHPREQSCGHITLVQDKLKSIDLGVGYELTFDQVVAKLGTPDYVRYGYALPNTSSVVNLIWRDKGIIVRTTDNRNSLLKEFSKCEPKKIILGLFRV